MTPNRRTFAAATGAVLAAAVLAGVAGSSVAQTVTGSARTTATRVARAVGAECVVTPIVQPDLAVGAEVSAAGSVTLPVSFAVQGACSPAGLSGLRWIGSSAADPTVLAFGYHSGARPLEVGLTDDRAGLVTIRPRGARPGVRQDAATLRIRDGAWLSLDPEPTPEGVFILVAQQWAPGLQRWTPLGGRVDEQRRSGGHWVTLKSAVITRSGLATLSVPRGVQVRFIVAGSATREPAVLVVP